MSAARQRPEIDSSEVENVFLSCLSAAIESNGEISIVMDAMHKDLILEVPAGERLQDAIRGAFDTQAMLPLHRNERVKSFAKSIGVALDMKPDRPVLALNLAELMCLPCKDIKAELTELQDFLFWVRDVMSANPEKNIMLGIFNNRDHSGKVYAEWRIGKQEDAQANAALRQRLDASPTLQHLGREVALSLGKLGPWSWLTVTQEALFSFMESPHMEHLRAEREKTKAKAKGPR